MSIARRGPNSYQVRVKPFAAVTLPTREAAKTVELDLRMRVKLGHLYREKPQALGDELNDFFHRKETFGGRKGKLRPNGLSFYENSIKPWAPLRDVMLPNLTRALVEDHITRRARRAPTAARNELQVLKAALKQARSRGQQVDPGIFDIPTIQLERREGVALEPEALDRIQSWMPEHIGRIVPLVGTVGLRLMEALRLEDEHLRLDESVIVVPGRMSKNRKAKAIALAQVEVGLLREQLLARPAGTRVVFPNRRGGFYSNTGFYAVWWSAAEAAGLAGVRFHDLRHTAISLQARAGIPAEVIAERVGHTDGGALIRRLYRHLYEGEAAAHVAKLDVLLQTLAREEATG